MKMIEYFLKIPEKLVYQQKEKDWKIMYFIHLKAILLFSFQLCGKLSVYLGQVPIYRQNMTLKTMIIQLERIVSTDGNQWIIYESNAFVKAVKLFVQKV